MADLDRRTKRRGCLSAKVKGEVPTPERREGDDFFEEKCQEPGIGLAVLVWA